MSLESILVLSRPKTFILLYDINGLGQHHNRRKGGTSVIVAAKVGIREQGKGALDLENEVANLGAD